MRKLVVHHGYEQRQVATLHYGGWKDWARLRRKLLEYGGELRAIAMLRDPAFNEAAQQIEQQQRFRPWKEDAVEHWIPTLELAAGDPMLPIRYEDIVEDPEKWGRRVVDFLECGPWLGWPVEIYDGNEKHRAAGVARFNATTRRKS